MKFEGGCHCGAVRFEVEAPQRVAVQCNCSICCKKGFLHVIVPKEDFTLLSGAQVLSTYRFNTGVAQHQFCATCGMHPFYVPRSHPHGVSVNLRCLDGEKLADWTIEPFDGKNWEANVENLR